jgi:hypothetical protein
MIETQHAEPSKTAGATAPVVDKSVVPAPEKAIAPAATDKSEPKQQQSWLQRRIQIEKDWLKGIDESVGRLRHRLITILPNFIVNSSSNILGAIQMVGEVCMVKSANVNLLKKKLNGVTVKASGINYLLYPIDNVFGAAFRKSNLQKVDWKNFIKPHYWKETVANFIDLERAAKIDSSSGSKALVNSFSVRSGLMGMVSMSVAMLFPDHKDTAEETEASTIQQNKNPIGYVATRVFQAVWFPFETIIQCVKKIAHPNEDQNIGIHKRQFAGLGMIATGLLSFLSGFRQINGDFLAGQAQHYQRNIPHMIGSLITAFAGSQLMLGVDNQQGWTRFGSIQIGRLFTMPFAIADRFQKKETNKGWYLASQAVFQTKNFSAALIGGAEKDADGNIVDHKAMREEAKREIAADMTKHPRRLLLDAAEEAPAQPATKVTRTAEVALAMPDRHATSKADQRDAVGA